MRQINFVFLFILIFSGLAAGQNTNPDPDPTGEGRRAAVEHLRRDSSSKMAQMENARPTLPQIKRWYGRLTKEQKKLLSPTEEDFAQHSEFLKKSKTGLAKLFPNPKCHEIVVDAGDENCINAFPIPGRGAFYSFRKKSHSEAFWWDIHFVENSFTVDFRKNSGLTVNLGNVPLESINLETAEIKSLKDFPLVSVPKARSNQQVSFSNEIEIKKYAVRALARENTTYAIRTVIYKGIRHPRVPVSYGLKVFYNDVITVFRVVKQNSDGSVILIWRELSERTG